MSSGPSFHTGRAITLSTIVAVVAGFACQSTAQTLRSRRVIAPPAPVTRLPQPLNHLGPGDLPLQRISKEQAAEWTRQLSAPPTGGFAKTAAVAPPATTPQFIDLTTTPRPPLVGASTLSQEIHPMWSWDQQSIYFSSNNVDATGSYGTLPPPGNATFHIYQMSSNGTFISRVTGTSIAGEANGNQFYPAVNHSLTKLAYVHRNGPTEPYELYVYDFFTRQREQLTGLNINNSPVDSAALIGVERPSWSPGDGIIAFAARNKNITGDPLNIYVVDVVSKVVRRLTNATAASGVECKDPTFHPSSSINRVTFSANTGNPAAGAAINGGTGDLVYRANPLQDLRQDGSANDVDHNLFTVSVAGASAGAPVVQLTSSTADDVEPIYNESAYPPNPGGTGAYHTYVAFSSLGRQNGRTYDIYFFNGGAETAGNVPIRLFTPDTNAGAVPLNGSDERYPAWSSSLPPQNPIDRIAFSSNRQNNVNDLSRPTVSATDTDIWAAEVTDITPPTLFYMDEQAGEVLHIANAPLPNPGRRTGAAGDRFYFYAKVKDLQYGVESVWVQIKDPDGSGTDSASTNHKLYGTGVFPNPNAGPADNVYPVRWINNNGESTHFLHLPWETDYEGLGVSDYQYYRDPVRFDPASRARARYASYSPGVDDAVRWSGNANRPPLDANGGQRWLRLNDDGVFPDLTAGDDVYSSSWVSPQDPSDYFVDLICYDKAFDPTTPSAQQNWIMYDNIWGFSTQPFVSTNPVLYVDDNGAGQKWPRGLKGSARPFPNFRFGTESDIIERDPQFLAQEWRKSTATVTGGNLVNPQDAGGSPAPGNRGVYDFLSGPSLGTDFINWRTGRLRAYRYDIWRILAKGPMTETVLANYTPTVDQQPLDARGDTTINRPLPRRAVVWSAPYTGDIFAGAGSILDQATQTLLANYQSRAGRLVVAGGDIMWALTGGNTQNQHPFHQNILGADFVQDEGNYGPNPVLPADEQDFRDFIDTNIGRAITRDAAGNNFDDLNGGSPPWWAPDDYDASPLGMATDFPSQGSNFHYGDGNVPWTAATDGTPFATQDRLAPRAGWSEVYGGRMVAQNNTTTSSKTVFMSFSLASMGRRYGAENTDAFLDCLNYKAKISHAMFCWMFSADLVGQVTNINGGAPISGAWVQAYAGGTLVGSAFSRADGTYTIRGLPVGGWNILVSNPGFLGFNKATSSAAHGLDQSQLDVLLTPAAPGSISGTTLDQEGDPVAGVKVHATLQANALYTGVRDFYATSQADGTYIIPSAPVGQYTVTLDPPLPTGFTTFSSTFQSPITVNQSQSTPNIDFVLQGGPGDLTVQVFRQQPDGTKGAALPSVEITLLSADGSAIPGMVGLTDSQGSVTFTAVPAGPITVSAYKQAFQESAVVVSVPQQTTPVEILLVAATAQSVYGKAVRAVDNAVLTAADLNPPVSLQLLRKVSQLPIGTTTNVFSPPLTTPKEHNYRFDTFEGSYTVALRDHPRFFDAEVDVTVTAAMPSEAPPLVLIGKPGVLSGQVNETSGNGAGAPINGASVQVIAQTGANAGQTLVTLITGSDGRWTTTGSTHPTLASELYTLQITKFGFSSRTLTDVFVAGDTTVAQTLLVKSPRGQVYGLARRAGDGTVRPNVTIQFWTLPTSPYGQIKVAETVSTTTTSTGPDGQPVNYTIGGIAPTSEFLPEGDYQVRVVGDTRFAGYTGSVTVVGGQARRFNVDLTPLGGTLSGYVKEDIDTTGGAVAGPPIAGATVRIMIGTSVVASATTDSNGQYQTTSVLAPGSYTVVATAFGFRQNSVSVFVEGPTSSPITPDVLLERLPPATIVGAITRKNATPLEYIADATVELVSLADGSVVRSTFTTNPSGTINYTLTDVPAGTYILRATKPGWTSAMSASFSVSPDSRVVKNLEIDAQYTFGRGLMLISPPYDFPGQDAAAVLGVDPAVFKSAYWVPSRQEYAYYHLGQSEAKEFRLGKAMFVRLDKATPFTRTGAAAPNTPLPIPVKAGWNMIGSGRTSPIQWVNVRVATPDGVERPMQAAMDAGIVGNGIYSFMDQYFLSDTMRPFQGYYMKANQECTLIVPVSNDPQTASGSSKRASKQAAMSLDQVAAEIAAAGLGPVPTVTGSTLRTTRSDARRSWVPAASLPFTKSNNNPFELWPWRPGLG